MKINKLVIILCLLFSITACVSYTELNELGIIDTIIINKKDNVWHLDVNMIIPTEEDEKNSILYSVTGNTLVDAINNIYLVSSKKIYLSHLNLLALTPSISTEDIDNIIDFFLARDDTRNTFDIVVLNNYEPTTNYQSEDIINLIESNHKEKGNVCPTQFDKIIKDILELKTAYIPVIDNKMNILGYSKIYNNPKELSLDESFIYNVLTNQTDQVYLDINNSNIKINSVFSTINVNKQNIILTITSNITNDKGSYEKYINELIYAYLENNTLEYFNNLIKKYDYYYYIEHPNIDIKFKIKLLTTVNNIASKRGEKIYD